MQCKGHEARSQKTQVPVSALQFTTKCKYFISLSLEFLIYKMKINSLLLHRVILMITNISEGKARKGCVHHRKKSNIKLPFMKFNTRLLDEPSQTKQQKQSEIKPQ